jgi:hypothetical protein
VTVRVVLLAICMVSAALISSARAQTSQEEVKATFLYRFASFVSWPSSAFGDAATPVQLCVIGADPMVRVLTRTTAAQRIGARSFAVRRVADADDIVGCHLLYVVGDRTEAALRAARRHAVLTITDGGGERGIIHFTVVDARVRFYIDDALAFESGLNVDPRLLSLAISVRRRSAS